jgi:hypothetical protein
MRPCTPQKRVCLQAFDFRNTANMCLFFKRFVGFLGTLFLALLPTAGFAQERVASSSRVGDCELRLEADTKWQTLSMRVRSEDHGDCRIDQQTMAAAIHTALSGTAPPIPRKDYTSLSIGRLVEYPWLSLSVVNAARNDPEFDVKKGKPRSKDLNKYVADLLRQEEACKQLSEVLAGSGYEVVGVSVEKVLVGAAKDILSYQGEPFSGRVPFDAQVWYRLMRK